MKNKGTIFTRFLGALGVPHTRGYSDEQFRGMTFKSLFGFSHLLKDYGIPSEGWKLTDKSELTRLTPPFLAQLKDGVFVIAEEFNDDGATITYDRKGERKSEPLSDFADNFNGIVLLAYPDRNSSEPQYRAHALSETIGLASRYLLVIAAIGIIGYFFITRGVWRYPSIILIAFFDCLGLWLSYMLLQKSLGIHTSASEKVCGVLEKGGCDVITSSKASKLFGVFSWSEVGFGYFGTSLVTLLLFPDMWPALAACNICCLPYTVWSISYQRFVAHHWCTLCVGVQATLWAIFFCNLAGGWIERIFPLRFDLLVLVGVYIVSVLALNRLLSSFKKITHNQQP